MVGNGKTPCVAIGHRQQGFWLAHKLADTTQSHASTTLAEAQSSHGHITDTLIDSSACTGLQSLLIQQRHHNLVSRIVPGSIEIKLCPEEVFQVELSSAQAYHSHVVNRKPTSARITPSSSHNGPARTSPNGPTIQLPPLDHTSSPAPFSFSLANLPG